MATIVAAAGGGNWTTGATWVGGNAPTAADDAQLNGTSGNVTINAGSVCRSLDCTGYVGTLTHTAAVALTIGDATAGAGNIALKLVAGMTYTLGSISTSTLSFVSTSATQQTITTGGKNLGGFTINGAGSSYQLADNNSAPAAAAVVVLTAGTLDTNGVTCIWGIFSSTNSNVRALILGASSITMNNAGGGVVWNMTTATNATISAASSTITIVGNASFACGINSTWGNLVFASGVRGITTLAGATFANVTVTGSAVKTNEFLMVGTMTVTGTLSINGNSPVNRLRFGYTFVGTTVSVTAAAVSLSNVDFYDIQALGAAIPWTGTSLGDEGGNSNITFTTPQTNYWVGNGGNWSDVNHWASSTGGAGASGRVPLPQDSVRFDANSFSSAGQTVHEDMFRLGKDIDFTGVTNSPIVTQDLSSSSVWIHGNLTLVAGMTLTSLSVTYGHTLGGRGSQTLTTAGQTFPALVQVWAPGSTWTLQGDLITNGAFHISTGTFTANGFNVTAVTIESVFAVSRTVNMGSGTWTTTSTAAAAVWNFFNGPGVLTVNAGTSTIVIDGGATANTRTFAGLGKTYNILTHTTVGSTGTLSITGANTFNTINFSNASGARTLTLPASTTTTITGSFNVQGTVSGLMTVNSSSAGTTATLTKPNGVVHCDYLSIRDSTATGGARWYAGGNSTSVSNNVGWIFASVAVEASFMEFFN